MREANKAVCVCIWENRNITSIRQYAPETCLWHDQELSLVDGAFML